ncbi:hypothetical protein EAG_07722, partial [Camponotus floridanus]
VNKNLLVIGCSHTGCSLGRKGMKASHDA